MAAIIFSYDIARARGYITATCRGNKRLSVAVRVESALAKEIKGRLERRYKGWAVFQIENPEARKADMAFSIIHGDELKAHLMRYRATYGK